MLSIDNLDHTYTNGVKALSNVSLEISNGMFGLLGPNGAGKSTLMRTVATLQQPTRGAIQFNDIDVLREPEKLRRVLGYLPQEFGVYPRGTALQILDQLALMKGLIKGRERKSVVECLLHRTNLFDVRHRKLSTFSGGMRRRFGIAQALLGDPRLLIVDEPTAGLDPEERNRFYNLLAGIGDEVAVVLSTHIVGDVAVLCSKVAIMHQGRVVSQDSPTNLKSALEGRVWQQEISREDIKEAADRYDLVSHHFAGGRPVIRVLSDVCPGRGFQLAHPNLEDVYFTAIKSVPRDSRNDKQTP